MPPVEWTLLGTWYVVYRVLDTDFQSYQINKTHQQWRWSDSKSNCIKQLYMCSQCNEKHIEEDTPENQQNLVPEAAGGGGVNSNRTLAHLGQWPREDQRSCVGPGLEPVLWTSCAWQMPDQRLRASQLESCLETPHSTHCTTAKTTSIIKSYAPKRALGV